MLSSATFAPLRETVFIFSLSYNSIFREDFSRRGAKVAEDFNPDSHHK